VIVLAVDPGVTTGAVLFEPLARTRIRVIEATEIPGEQNFYDWLTEDNHTRITVTEHCVCEDWKPRGGYHTWHAEPLWIAGAVRTWFGTENVTMQLVGDALKFGTTAKLDSYDETVPKTKDDHQRMALRHALLWTSNQRWLPA
jgi:hypothetical protein